MTNNNYYRDGYFIKREKIRQTFFINIITRNVAYLLQTLFIKSLIFINRLGLTKEKDFKYSVSLCSIFKNESKFLQEWISYHLVIGVEHFYLYNNNSDDEYLEILEPYIKDGIVDLIDWPMEQPQMPAYEDCYNKRKTDTEWLGFIDIDEFICPNKYNNLYDFLKSYNHYSGVAIYWKQFGSNGILKHDNSKLVIEQYSQCWYQFSTFTKMFCNMRFPIFEFNNPHIMYSKLYGIKIPPVNQFKNIICFGINKVNSIEKNPIQINHYWGKAYDCFVRDKIQRSDVFHSHKVDMGNVRKQLLKSHEEMCTVRDYRIQRFLLFTKLKMKNIQ